MGKATAEEDAAEWTLTLREVFQDVQMEAIEESQYHTTKSGAKGATSGGETAAEREQQDEETRGRDERALVPAVRRLQHIYRTEVGEGDDMAEEQWLLFVEEMWLAMARVLVAPKIHAVTVGTISSFVGLFLRTMGTKAKADEEEEIMDQEEDKETEKTATETEKSANEMRSELLNRLMDATKAEDKNVRLRACQMLQLVLSKLEYIGEETFGRLRKVMIPRASDKLATVRMQSVFVLKRLQDEEDPADEVTAELVRLMVSDPSKDVRKAAVQNVAMTKVTYRDVVIRIRDVSDEVRAAAFLVFRDGMKFKDITINDRAQLLDQGLQDRSPAVREACEQMLVKRWLEDNHHSPTRLLRALDVEQYTELCTKVSKLLLKYHSSNNPFEQVRASISVEDILAERDDNGAYTGDIKDALDGASVFFWREQCMYYRDDEKDEEKLAVLLPSITDYIKVLALAGSSDEDGMMFVMQQLLALARCLDFQDEYGRRVLLESLRKLLGDPSVDTNLIPSIMELMANIYAIGNSQADFVRVVAEIMSDLYDPLDSENTDEDPSGLSEEELDAATKRFEHLEEQLEELEPDTAEYIAVQKEMEDLEKILQDPKVLAWLRCLEILSQLLKLTNYNLKHPVISGVGRYILPSIESDIPAIRETGMECLGLFCLLDRRVAERHLVVFWRALNNADEEREVKMNCIRAIMDMVFSFANLTPQVVVAPKVKSEDGDDDDENSKETNAGDEDGDGEENTSDKESAKVTTETLKLETVFLGLAKLAAASHDDLDIQSTIVEGFAKLFLMHRVRSPPVLAFLVETFFSPRLQKVQLLSEHGYQARALQLMSVFFPTFVKASTSNCSLFEEASIYLIQKCVEKHEASDATREALNQIDLGTCCKYLFHLLSHSDESADVALKKQEPEDSSAAPSLPANASINQRCAHHNRVAINMCVDLLALEKLRKATPKIDASEIDSRQKLLVKTIILTDISAAEHRSALLLLSLLREVTTTCFTSQRALGKNLEALLKRLSASYALGRRQLGKPTTNDAVIEQDQEWSNDRIDERAKALRAGIREGIASRKKVRRRSANSNGSRRSSTRRKASDSDEDSDEDSGDEDSDEEMDGGKPAAAPVVPQRRSSRQSTSQAVDRMREKNRNFDVAMKAAFEEEGDEDEEDEDEEESESESDDDDE